MPVNTQPRSKLDFTRDGIDKPLQVTEIFDTIQGEGPWAGKPCTFIRLSGCPLQCTWCDTDYTHNDDMMVEAIVDCVGKNNVVITGGEPMRQQISPLVIALVASGFRVQIETSGVCVPSNFPWDLCTVVCSPKTSICKEVADNADAFKFVVDKDCSGLQIAPTQGNGKLGPDIPHFTRLKDRTYVMPLTDKHESLNTQRAIDICERLGYTLSLRLHKILGLP